MKASAVEFRWRFVTLFVIYLLGFWAPWNYALHLDGTGPNAHVWGSLAAMLAKAGVAGIGTAFDVLLSVGIACATLAAWLRTWAAAYLGVGVVQASRMTADGVVADGPYRYMRNPLYIGIFLHTLALGLLMPPSGAVFAVMMTGIFTMRLILAEEAFLAGKLGAPYASYGAQVPRIVPSLRGRVAPGGVRPQWLRAGISEIYVWCVAGAFAIAGWWYNADLLMRCVVVSLGVSIVLRGLVGTAKQ
jgi:protein-S-isoprenylcysteine O-methyltransferase Ste14